MGIVNDTRQETLGDSKRIVTGRVNDSAGDPIVLNVGFKALKVRAINRTTLTEYEYFDGMRGTTVLTAPFAYKTLAAGTKTRETSAAEGFVIDDRTVAFPTAMNAANEIIDYVIEG
jgi:hypothetical protein